jgi:hypothetical protein
MERTLEGYRDKLRTLLARVKPRRLEFGVELLVGRARDKSRREAIPLSQALAEVYESTRTRVEKRVALMVSCEAGVPEASPLSPCFLCDANLGGLARWLRAAGYEARWTREIADAQLVDDAAAQAAVLVTGDVGILRRRAVRAGSVHAVWIPSSLSPLEQLSMLLRELQLPLRAARCMTCGGALTPTAKDEVRDRIPPRTALWKDDYFLCGSCGKLFWRGTHWDRIAVRLAEALRG